MKAVEEVSDSQNECKRNSRSVQTSLAASMRRSWRNAGLSRMACTDTIKDSLIRTYSSDWQDVKYLTSPQIILTAPINIADLASPSALITIVRFSWIALSTMYLALSESCWATCFASTAAEYAVEKARFVMDTSSSKILKSPALFTSMLRICVLTRSRFVSSSEALYCATTALVTSFTIDGSTRSS